MTTADFIRKLKARDIRLYLESGGLKCSAPQGALTPEDKQELKARKPEIIELLSLAGGGAADPGIRPVPREEEMPCSAAQRRMWLLWRMEPDTPNYNLPMVFRLEGKLDVTALETALARIVARHEILRTIFVERDGEPRQKVLADQPFRLEMDSLDDYGSLEEAVSRWVGQVFDLTQGPLFRATLIRVGDDSHVLVLNMHHIISDGWSSGIIGGELVNAYEALSAGHEPSLPSLDIQYTDYAAWEQRQEQSGVYEQQLAYWKRALKDAPSAIDLPTDHPRPSRPSLRGGRVAFQFPRNLTGGLHALASRYDVTVSTVLLAGFRALLARLSGDDDICIGMPTANRDRPELESLIGFFVNTLVIRNGLDQGECFRNLLEREREAVLDAYANQTVAFEDVVQALLPSRSASHSPLFQVMFTNNEVSQDTSAEPMVMNGVEIAPYEQAGQYAKFDLTLAIQTSDEEISGGFEYARDLFDQATIDRWAGYYQRVLEAMVADDRAAIHGFALPHEQEQWALLARARNSRNPGVNPPCLLDRITENARHRAQAKAVIGENTILDFRTLDTLSDRAAALMRRHGVKTGDRVGLYLGRSELNIVAMLAAWKAGAAYVPLDPRYPEERLAYIVRDGELDLVVHEAGYETHRWDISTLVLSLDALRSAPRLETTEEWRQPHPEQAAYIIYTSGSTGRPKGVVVSHRNIAHFAQWYIDENQLGVGDRCIHFSAPGFDASAMDIWPALTAGAALHIVPEGIRTDAVSITDWLKRHSIHVAFLPTPVVESLVGAIVALPESLRVINTGGDRLKQRLPAEANIRLNNLYGPTEGSIAATAGPVSSDEAEPITIGRPIHRMAAYVLDQAMHPVPEGVLGELYIAGPGVALGYHGRAGLTAEKFLPDPFSDTPGARLYRTGDLVRWQANGDLVFCGRADDQIQLRGFRIEPGEIEEILLGHAAVKQAAVQRREGVGGGAYLAAFIAVDEGADSEEEGLKDAIQAYMASQLPDYMLPAMYVLLDALPVTRNGKVDRKALPETAIEQQQAHSTPPRTGMETHLAAIWRELLAVDTVGREDNFFVLGGHSLLATRLASRVREALDVELPLKTVFEAPVLAAMAARLEAVGDGDTADTLPRIQRVSREERLPLSFAQQRLWMIDRIEGVGSVYNIPSAVRLEGRLDYSAMERAFATIVRRHESLRTVFLEESGEPRQVVMSGESFGIPVIDLSALAGDEREAALEARVQAELNRPFRLDQDLMIRVTLFKLAEESHVLTINMHHIASDGWSAGILIQELRHLYKCFLNGESPELPELPVQYGDFAYWQRHVLGERRLDQELAYWRDQLADLPVVHSLPLDRARPANQSFRGDIHYQVIPGELHERLLALAEGHDVTLFMLLQAAFSVLLGRYSHQDDIVIGTPIAGRTSGETEGLIGCFLNTLVLRTDLSGNPPFTDLLRRVKKTALDGYANQHVPFELLVEELQPSRNFSHNPLFQIMFTLQNNEVGEMELPGLSLGSMEHDHSIAKFDVNINAMESEEGIRVGWEFATDLFDRETIERMASQYEQLMWSLVDEPERNILGLDMLPPSEKHLLWDSVNDTGVDRPIEQCMHALFLDRVAATPDATAIIDEEGSVSYGELFVAAQSLSRRLSAYCQTDDSAKTGDPAMLAVLLPKGRHQIIACLAILMAGGAYLPLDTEWPVGRCKRILSHADAVAVVGFSADGEGLSDHWPFVSPSTDQPAVPVDVTARARAFPIQQAPTDLAYVIFTSGSTGQPKGVAIEHRSAVNTLLDINHRLAVDQNDRILGVSALSFDLSVYDVFGLLAAGGCVVLPSEERKKEPAHWVDLVERHGVTLWDTVPLLTGLLIDECEARSGLQSPTLRACLMSGDWLPPTLPRRIWKQFPACRAYSLGGATEGSIWSIMYPIERDTSELTSVPYGKPLDNQTFHVLNDALGFCPVGVPGELHIGGVGVAREYFRDPERTRQQFIQHPETGERLYRTGDLGRYLPDGNIEFLGRKDQQVKLRGFRVELGEIRATLELHEAVEEAVVLTVDDEVMGRQLVAYFVASPASRSDGLDGDLRAFMRSQLPLYMVPAVFVALDSMPLSANGKLDRKALPAPDFSQNSAAHVAPETESERVIAGILESLLDRGQVSVTADFFEMGGHSLLATRLVARIYEALGVRLSMRALFTEPTVRGMASVVDERIRNGGHEADDAGHLLELKRGEEGEPPLFLVHPVGGYGYCYGELSRHIQANRSIYALQSDGMVVNSLAEMAARYIAEIKAVQPQGPYLLGGWSMGGVVAQEMAAQLTEAGESVGPVIMVDSHNPVLIPDEAGDDSDLAALRALTFELGISFPERCLQMTGRASDAVIDEALSLVHASGLETGVLPTDMTLDELKHRHREIVSNSGLLARHEPRRYDGAIQIIQAEHQPGELPHRQWVDLAEKTDYMTVAGDHFTMMRGESAKVMAQTIGRVMEEKESWAA